MQNGISLAQSNSEPKKSISDAQVALQAKQAKSFGSTFLPQKNENFLNEEEYSLSNLSEGRNSVTSLKQMAQYKTKYRELEQKYRHQKSLLVK